MQIDFFISTVIYYLFLYFWQDFYLCVCLKEFKNPNLLYSLV